MTMVSSEIYRALREVGVPQELASDIGEKALDKNQRLDQFERALYELTCALSARFTAELTDLRSEFKADISRMKAELRSSVEA